MGKDLLFDLDEAPKCVRVYNRPNCRRRKAPPTPPPGMLPLWERLIDRPTMPVENLGLVWRAIASIRLPAGLGRDEAISVGKLALVNAARLYDPAMGYKFTTYAVTSIKRAIQEAAYGSRIIKGSRRLARQGRMPECQHLERPQDLIARQNDHNPSLAEKLLTKALSCLNDQQRLALEWRYREGWSYDDIAKSLNVGPKRSRRIVARALAIVKDQMEM